MDQQLQFSVHSHCKQPLILSTANYSDATEVSVTRMQPSTGWSLAITFKKPKPLPYMGNGISTCHSTGGFSSAVDPSFYWLTAVVYLYSTLMEEYNLRDTAIPHCMAVVSWTHLCSTLCKSTILWTHPCSTLQRNTVYLKHTCSTLCTVVLWKHPCSLFHTMESRLINRTMLHTMKEYNLIDKHEVPVCRTSYSETDGEAAAQPGHRNKCVKE
jgi:hypothetical protein